MAYKTVKGKFKAEFQALKNAIDRCQRKTHPQYDDYGGRGIAVDPEFTCPITGFAAFLADVGKKPDPSLTLDRICNDRGYEPGNLQWTSRSNQQANRRKIKAKPRDFGWGIGHYKGVREDGQNYNAPSPLIRYKGRLQTVRHWSEETGLATSTILQRLKRGWPLKQVLNPMLFNPHNKPRKDQTIH